MHRSLLCSLSDSLHTRRCNPHQLLWSRLRDGDLALRVFVAGAVLRGLVARCEGLWMGWGSFLGRALFMVGPQIATLSPQCYMLVLFVLVVELIKCRGSNLDC